MESIKLFAEYNLFLREFCPYSCYAKAYKAKLPFIFSQHILKSHFDKIEFTIGEITNFPSVQKSKIEFLLKNLHAIENIFSQNSLEITDCFLIKSFLHNYKNLISNINSNLSKKFNLSFEFHDLYDFLVLGGGDNENFFISDNYSEKLKSIRYAINDKIKLINTEKEKYFSELKDKFSINFDGKDFVILPIEKYKIDSKFLYSELFDNNNVLVKPIFNEQINFLQIEKQKLILEEKQIETEIVNLIFEKFKNQSEKLKSAILVITDFDVIYTHANLAINKKLKRPKINSATESTTYFENFSYLPLENKLNAENIKYTALNFEFTNKTNVIHGSNMGGKTVVLQTIAFAQLLTQHGFFVPGEFQTNIYEKIHYIGDIANSENLKGLSSFGLEIFNFTESYTDREKKTLYLIDEFAKTTNSKEAAALISAILHDFSKRENITTFISTHFNNIYKSPKISFLRMKGFNKKLHSENFKNFSDATDLYTKLKNINQSMIYELEQNNPENEIEDAISVSEILGLDKKIIENAKKYKQGGFIDE